MSEMMAQLLGGMGGDGAAPQAPMGDGAASPAPQGEGGDTTDLIRQALELVRQYASQEETEQNVLNAEKITTLLQTILAQEEKELEDAMQGKASPRMLRSAYGG